MKVKKLREIVNKGLDLTIKEMKQLTPEELLRLMQATEELISHNIKATDKEDYKMLLETLQDIAPPLETLKKVANKKAPTEEEKEEKKEEKEEKKKEKEEKKKAPKNNKTDKNKAMKLTDTIKIGDIVKFRLEGEEIEHPIKIIYKSKYDIIAITENEKEIFKIRKVDFNKQAFEWKDRHGEKYNILVTI